METDKDPTFAEALLAAVIAEQEWKKGESIVDAWRIASERAASFVRGRFRDGYVMNFCPPEIRRALGADAPGGNSDRVRGCEDTLNRHAQWITENEVAISELKKAALGVDKSPESLSYTYKTVPRHAKPMILDEDLDRWRTYALGLEPRLAAAVARAEKAEAQAAEARDAFTLAVGERDDLRAERDRLAVIVDRAGKIEAAKLDAARKALDAKETT